MKLRIETYVIDEMGVKRELDTTEIPLPDGLPAEICIHVEDAQTGEPIDQFDFETM